jgi:hypothetical protein
VKICLASKNRIRCKGIKGYNHIGSIDFQYPAPALHHLQFTPKGMMEFEEKLGTTTKSELQSEFSYKMFLPQAKPGDGPHP